MNLATTKIKAYFHCRKCFARAPRISVEDIETFSHNPRVPKPEEVPESVKAAEKAAHDVAMLAGIDPFDLDDDAFAAMFAIDDDE